MKLTAFIILAFCLQVSATAFSQHITYSGKNVSLEECFSAIRSQTGYSVAYDVEQLKLAKPVNIKAVNEPLSSFLDRLLAGQPFRYSIKVNTVFISQKTAREKITFTIPEIKVKAVAGIVKDNNGAALMGATVMNKQTRVSVTTDASGRFSIPGQIGETLIVSYIGFKPKEVSITEQEFINISLLRIDNLLDTAAVVSTGYQQISRERTTGSFDFIDNKLINRSVSTNILDRINNVASGVFFNKNQAINEPAINIRGRSTIFANANPLIVLDNFPYDGDIKNINPNDIENITVLKDAAAASIWGVRAGNGVIVITTKRGRLNQRPKISFTGNVTVQGKEDLFSVPHLTSEEYVNLEENLFRRGLYNSRFNNAYNIASPAVAILQNRKLGLISAADSAAQLDELRNYNGIQEYADLFLRSTVMQQYLLNVSGGGNNNKYYFSVGYDDNLANRMGTYSKRLTLTANNTYHLYKDKVQFTSGIILTNAKSGSSLSNYSPVKPYERLRDANGQPAAVVNQWRKSYKDTAGNGNLLNWDYRPLEEQGTDSRGNLIDYNINFGLDIKILKGLKAGFVYQLKKGTRESNSIRTGDSYFVRDLINQYTQVNYANNSVIRPIPLGDIFSFSIESIRSNSGRAQLNYDLNWGSDHELTALGGLEIREIGTSARSNTLYGYNQSTASSIAVDPVNNYVNFVTKGSGRLPVSGPSNSETLDRFISIYFNGAYTYAGKYILSGSLRKDESNLFGVSANMRGVPLWSAGIAWDISKEDFYKVGWLPRLKLKLTKGYNGNLSKNLSAYTTAGQLSLNQMGQAILSIINPPNPSLQWEKVNNTNLALEFASRNGKIRGSVEGYLKEGLNLIGNSVIAPQTGVIQFTGNTANTRTKGVDLNLSADIFSKPFQWTANLLFQLNTNEITQYNIKQPTAGNLINGNYTNPMVGKPYSAIFSYRWGGLDNAGNPIGYLNGKESQEYSKIVNSVNLDEVIYNGPATPVCYGSLRNSFGFRNFEFSFNTTYKLGYFIRRGSLDYSKIVVNGGFSYLVADYSQRWQKPGDELITNVPALVYPNNDLRNSVYTNSEILVEKGDHIRIYDFQLSYSFNEHSLRRSPFSSMRLYAYATNLNLILWRANRSGLDPDYVNQGIYSPRQPVAFSIGINTTFK
ncbi:MAG: SusC/RagA family TonB-linked outer membrane protein [Pseudobacter sp.]|uniref:SusC/RagA family TonB-linked outer membrane protein n=1 Tax=Pseudobacter sp. TaxID=2045420 RepID=UPI003F805709